MEGRFYLKYMMTNPIIGLTFVLADDEKVAEIILTQY
jgi:hypothetical protein